MSLFFLFFFLPLLQVLSYSITPAVVSQVETMQHHFIHTAGQNVLFRRFPLRKKHSQTFHSPTGKGGVRKYWIASGLQYEGLCRPCLPSRTLYRDRKTGWLMQRVSRGTRTRFVTTAVSEDWMRGVAWGCCDAKKGRLLCGNVHRHQFCHLGLAANHFNVSHWNCNHSIGGAVYNTT